MAERKFTSNVIVDTSSGILTIPGPSRTETYTAPGESSQIINTGSFSWLCPVGKSEYGIFLEKIQSIMKSGFYAYQPGKYGRVVEIQLFMDDSPLILHSL